ncbi:MAG TPA: PilZ domain-containing protein [Desulfuromonadales bacterium]|nr:PilZ domain-containing protein [Desulfuromonadales bacterium]
MDFTSLYSTRIQQSFDDDLVEILNVFRTKLAAKEAVKVTLINYFKGLPIIYPATVLAVDRGNLELDIHPQQAVAIEHDRYTMIRCPFLPHPLVSHVQYVNVKKHAAAVNKLCYVEILAEKRAALRLDVDPPEQAEIVSGEQTISGKLVSISSQGLAVNVDSYITLESDSDILVKFILPDPVLQKQVQLAVGASLVDIEGEGAPYRYKFRISPDKHQEQLLLRYSFQRQVEVIRSLKEAAE